MSRTASNEGTIVQFLRHSDYRYVKALGEGACGKTVLLHDDELDQKRVCKKFAPIAEEDKQKLFANFVREIRLLYQLHHENVVRVFNHYLYPEQLAGYILMEFIDGLEIEQYVPHHPEKINDLFVQAISGFHYLESRDVLHRDIRPRNLMVRDDGTLKIIDLGFGKHIQTSNDFAKSISLNWWCEPPNEFALSIYDYTTEVYFVGKLFQKLIVHNDIGQFKYMNALGRMCQAEPSERIQRFSDVYKEIRNEHFSEIDFAEGDLSAYRAFADAMCAHITKIEQGARYVDDIGRVEKRLGEVYRRFMLEEAVPDAAVVLRCFIDENYYYRSRGFPVQAVKDLLRLLKSSPEENKRVILANLHTRLDVLPRYDDVPPGSDIPF